MLHRRPGHGSVSVPSSGSSSASPSYAASPPPSSTTTNKAYTPLRRQSSGLYASNTPASGPRARYNLPSPIAAAGPNTSSSPIYARRSSAAGQTSYFPNGNALGLGYRSDTYDSGVGERGGLNDAWEGGAQGLAKELRDSVERLGKGLEDALRLDRSWTLVWSDRELRNLVLKSTMINILSLLLLSLSSLVFSPFLAASSTASVKRTREIGWWYNVLLSWPVFVLCFWINASWGPDISRRAQTMSHPTYRHQPSPLSTPTSATPSSKSKPPSNPYAWVFAAIARILLISDFTLVSRLLSLTPLVGRGLAFGYMCIINAYYCFEWTFSSKQWPLDYRVEYVQDRTAYMLGFGFLATFLTSFGPPLVNMAVFAVIYPFFVIQALQSRPPSPSSSSTSSFPRSSLLPSTPSPHASLPPSPSGGTELSLNDPFFSSTSSSKSRSSWVKGLNKVPIFALAQYALEGLQWLELALARDRSGAAGSGADAIGLGLRNVGVRDRAKRAM